MKKMLLSLGLALLFAGQFAFAHDPRTVAKDFSHSLKVEGAGQLVLNYKSLHYNETAYMNAKKNERVLTTLNRVWKTIGKFESEFDVKFGEISVPKGSYNLGINFDANDNFKLILSGGGNEIAIPLSASLDGPMVNYLSFDMRPENDTDTFTLEGRYGKIRASVEMKVPFLAPHEHGTTGHSDQGEAKKP